MSAAEAAVADATERATPAKSSRFIFCPQKLSISITPCGSIANRSHRHGDVSLWKWSANAPPKSRLQATLSERKNVRLRINHTIHMPAEIRPKRDRALARAGCYFDSSTTVCGAEVFALRRERDAAYRFNHQWLRNIEALLSP